MSDRVTSHQDAFQDADPEQVFCSRLESAMGDEQSAQSEYSDLVAAAEEAGFDGVAEGVEMISGQEATHENAFKSWHSLFCR